MHCRGAFQGAFSKFLARDGSVLLARLFGLREGDAMVSWVRGFFRGMREAPVSAVLVPLACDLQEPVSRAGAVRSDLGSSPALWTNVSATILEMDVAAVGSPPPYQISPGLRVDVVPQDAANYERRRAHRKREPGRLITRRFEI